MRLPFPFQALLLGWLCLLPLASGAQNQNISNGLVFDGEPFLVMDPANSQHLVAAWMGFSFGNGIVIKTKASFDGGQNWSAAAQIPHARPSYSSADPSLEFDGNGDLFLAYVDFDKVIDSGAVFLRKSTDGGLSWGNGVQVIDMHSDPAKRPIDRPWIAIDRSGGSYDGRIYVSTMNPGSFPVSPPYHPYLSYSVDGGASFQTWRYLDTTSFLAGNLIVGPMPTPVVTGNGNFAAIYPAYDPGQSPLPRYILAKSADGGHSLSHNTVFSSIYTFNDSLAKKGYLLRSDPADPNHLAFFYLNTDLGDADVFMRESSNGGTTWSNYLRVNDDPVGNDRMQDLVWADFDSDGDLIATWRDRRNGSNSTYKTETEIWAAILWKDSSQFSANFRISDTIVPYDNVLAESGNDFMCTRLRNDTLNSVWGDTRNGKLNIWFTRMGLDGSMVSRTQLASEDLPGLLAFPNPARSQIHLQAPAMQRAMLSDLQGRIILDQEFSGLQDRKSLDISGIAPGAYLLRVDGPHLKWSQKIIIE